MKRTPRHADTEPAFPYGTQYHRAPTPLPEEWEGDLKEIARAGYTHLQFRPQWRVHERIRGKRVWHDLDRLFELAEHNALRVVLKPMLETAPDWVFRELDGTRIGFHGVPISPFAHGAYYVGGWWPCFDNPQVASAAGVFVRALVRRYRAHPALWLYDLWNEPVCRPLGACHCDHSQESYRGWLRRRFGSIEQLNEAYGKAWTSYEMLRAPEEAGDYVEMFLWRQWAAFSAAEQVRVVAEAVRAADPEARTLVHVGAPGITQDVAWSASDDVQNAAHADRYGTSFWISLHPQTPTEHAGPELQSSWLRRVDPEYWCHEFYPKHANWTLPPDAQTLRRLIWSAIAGGATAFTFWQYRSERVGCETNGYGLRNIDGSPTPRSDVADEIAGILRDGGHWLAGASREPAPVALLYHREGDLISRIQVMPDAFEDLNQEPNRTDYPYKRAIHAMHAMAICLGTAPDWVLPGDDLTGRELLMVTGDEMVNEDTARWLKRFVKRGGNLLVEFPFACRDDRTWVSARRPAHGLDKLLGCREKDRRMATSQDTFRLRGFEKTLSAGLWRIELAPGAQGEVIGRWPDRSPAVIEHAYGRGRVISLGASLALAFQDRWRDPTLDALARLWSRLGLPAAPPARRGLVLHRRVGTDAEVWFAFNVAAQSRGLTLPSPLLTTLDACGAVRRGRRLTLEAGGCWVGVCGRPPHDS